MSSFTGSQPPLADLRRNSRILVLRAALTVPFMILVGGGIQAQERTLAVIPSLPLFPFGQRLRLVTSNWSSLRRSIRAALKPGRLLEKV